MLGKARIESAADGRRPISLVVKRAGEPSAGNRHARFEVAGAGNQLRTYGAMAPVPDPTCVQRRLACSVGDSPTGAKVRNPEAWVASEEETNRMKPTDKAIIKDGERVTGP